MLNKSIIMGRLTKEPELSHTKTGVPVCTITLAVERDRLDSNGVRDVDFLDVVAWRNTAEFLVRYMRKGQLIAVEGRLSTRRWKDKYEQNRVQVEIVADCLYFAEGRRDQVTAPAAETGAGTLPASPFGEFEDEDDDVPFI